MNDAYPGFLKLQIVWRIFQLVCGGRRSNRQRDKKEGGDLAYGQVPPLLPKRTGMGDKQPLHSYLVLWAVSPLGSFAVFAAS